MSTKFLFLDYRLYEYSRGFERRLNQPVAYSGNPIMEPELPQEFNRVLLYGSVIRDPESGLLRMWYNSSTREESLSNLLYAESDDGYGWRKPALDVIPGTNIVMDNDWDIHGPTIILDEAETDGARRYKMVARRARGALAGYISPDGIHWRLLRDEPLIYADSDCHIGFFRDPESGLYHTSFRDACPDRRMWRSESEAFCHLAAALEPDLHDPIQTQIYSLQMTPYGAYVLGWLHRYTTWESDMGPTKMNGNWDIELAFSRGGYCWHRPAQGEDFIPRDPGGWTAGLISPSAAPLFFDDEIRFYFVGCEKQHGDEYASKRFRIGVASLQPDRFLSLHAGEAQIMTRAFATREPGLFVNAAVAAGGAVRAELRDVDGVPIPGFELPNCVPLESDETAAQGHWRGNPSPAAFLEKPIRLCRSADGGKTWSEPAVLTAASSTGRARGFEVTCPILAWDEDRWLAPAGLLADAGSLGERVVVFSSPDAGQTWPHSPTVFHDPDARRCFFETKVIRLGGERLLAAAWTVTAGDYRDLDNQYALSRDGGSTWTRPISTGIRGQTMTPVWLGGDRLLVLYNRRYGRQGIVMLVVQVAEQRWILGPETMLWDAATAHGEVAHGAGGVDEFADFAFGLPSALPMGAGRLLAVHWCREAGRRGPDPEPPAPGGSYGVRWTRLQLSA